MATLLATQLAAQVAPEGHVVVYAARQLARRGMVAAWLDSMHPVTARRIVLVSCGQLSDLREHCRGMRVHAIYVDHHLLEQAEDQLEARIAGMRKEHAEAVHKLMSIR